VFVPFGWSLDAESKGLGLDASSSASFGFSVAVDGDTRGSRSRQLQTGQVGAAYLFVRSGATWTQQAKLTASDGTIGDRFAGRSL